MKHVMVSTPAVELVAVRVAEGATVVAHGRRNETGSTVQVAPALVPAMLAAGVVEPITADAVAG